MNITRPSMHKLIFALTLIGSLVGCDSGVGTAANPDLTGVNTGGYNGPPARTADIRSFELNFWNFLKEDNRCGQCHGAGQPPEFVDLTDVNRAYSQAMLLPFANLQDPATSRFVERVGPTEGHYCWLPDLAACETIMTQMISNWASASNITSARLIQLTAPPIKDPGDAKSFPASASDAGNTSSFEDTVYRVLIGTEPGISTNNCQGCHEETAMPLPIAPFFANDDLDTAYEAAKAKIDIDNPSNSRLVVRLREESHNCWSNDCEADAQLMQDRIQEFADGIDPTQVAQSLLTSKALNLGDGIVAAGGNRHESNLVALWEFKEDPGSPIAFDTSGIDPAVDLALFSTPTGGVTQMGGYGLDFSGGMARANTFDSDKVTSMIQSTGQYAIEAWVIPANVTQEDANIIGYSGSNTARNFTLGQRLYNYDFYNRTDESDTNGEPFFTSDNNNGNDILQASLQHVVINYHYDDGRSIYVNGELVPDANEPATTAPTTIGNWSDTYAFVLGNEVSGQRPWLGQIRMAAVHNRSLTAEQVTQNFDVGVGEKFFLLFSVTDRINISDSYILFEVSQFDSYSYLFSTPTFINLDPDWVPVAVNFAGMRIGINGKEAIAGQAFANIDVAIDGSYDPQFGQQLSPLGTIIALEKGATDEFFLTFESIGGVDNPYNEALPSIAADPTIDPPVSESDIGVRTFEEINTTISAITGIPVTNTAVSNVYDEYIQQLPSTEAIDAFLPSHQMAVTQLALTSCSEMVDLNADTYFLGFSFTGAGTPANPFVPAANAQSAFDTQGERDAIIQPLLTAAMNVDPLSSPDNLTSQPGEALVSDLLGSPVEQHLESPPIAGDEYDSLISEMLGAPVDTQARAAQIIKAVCATAAGSAVMLVQ